MLGRQWTKAAKSNGNGGANCVQVRWTKATASGGGNCVQVRITPAQGDKQ